MPSFDRLRYRRADGTVFLFAFDLLELNGQDLRREPLELRKRELGKLLRWAVQIGLQFNEHIAEPGEVVFRHACKMGLEWIVSKRLGSRYRSGRSPDWLKFKNPGQRSVDLDNNDCRRFVATQCASSYPHLALAALSRENDPSTSLKPTSGRLVNWPVISLFGLTRCLVETSSAGPPPRLEMHRWQWRIWARPPREPAIGTRTS
jgi:ATP dependent DNA ligase domain